MRNAIIYVCHTCKTFCDLNFHTLQVKSYDDAETFVQNTTENLLEHSGHIEFELFYLTKRIRFLHKHIGHRVDELCVSDKMHHTVIKTYTEEETIGEHNKNGQK